MLNIVIPVIGNVEKYRKLLTATANAFDVKVFMGVQHAVYQSVANEFGKVENFNLFEFDEKASKEQMINSMQEYIGSGSILILRKPISMQEFDKITSSDRDVVTSKVVRGKFSSFMFKFWQKLTKLIFGVKMYAGDTSVVMLGEDVAEVMLSTGNLSYSSRVNRWKGIKQGIVTTQEKGDKMQADKKLNLKYILGAVALLLIGAVVTTVVSIFVKMTIMIGLLLFGLDAICVSVGAILLTMMVFTNLTGKKQYGKAIVMNSIIRREE